VGLFLQFHCYNTPTYNLLKTFGGALVPLAPFVGAALNIQHMILSFPTIFANELTLISSLTKIFHFFQIYGNISIDILLTRDLMISIEKFIANE
jgi:hypothetical protein